MQKRSGFMHGEGETHEGEDIASGDSDTVVSGLSFVTGQIGFLFTISNVASYSVT